MTLLKTLCLSGCLTIAGARESITNDPTKVIVGGSFSSGSSSNISILSYAILTSSMICSLKPSVTVLTAGYVDINGKSYSSQLIAYVFSCLSYQIRYIKSLTSSQKTFFIRLTVLLFGSISIIKMFSGT